MKRNKPRQNIIKAFNAAIEGVIYTFKYERKYENTLCYSSSRAFNKFIFKFK